MRSKLSALHILALLRNLSETATVFLYPATCRVCEVPIGMTRVPHICDDCWQDIRFLEPPWCDICGTPNVVGLCDPCAINPPRYGKLRSVAYYDKDKALQKAIQLFKFGKKQGLTQHLVQLLNAYLPSDCILAEYDFILPVPIHKQRLKERGFNQSENLAKGIAAAAGIPVRTDILIRDRHTAAQSGLDSAARQENIKNAFKILDPAALTGKRLLLIDDVFTTGATIREIVNELWTADPAEIDVLTLARTLRHDVP